MELRFQSFIMMHSEPDRSLAWSDYQRARAAKVAGVTRDKVREFLYAQ